MTESLSLLNNFHYPVRITDNEECKPGDKKAYCNYFCDKYGAEESEDNKATLNIVVIQTIGTFLMTEHLF